MIAIVDTGGANIRSVANALDRLGQRWTWTTSPEEIARASHVILPGVGAARASMQRIETHGLAPVLRDLTQPVLGICLGMQLLFEWSEEGAVDCLGIVPARVRAIPRVEKLPIPHMGWNTVAFRRPCPLAIDLGDKPYFYFVHSFYGEIGAHTVADAEYGTTLSAVVERDNFFGVQFHPERSARVGAKLLENFLRL